MEKELLSFEKVKPESELIDQIWSLNIKNLDGLTDLTLSKYIIALSQWLVYYRSQVNLIKAELSMKQSDLEIGISAALTSDKDLIKRMKTRTAAIAYLVATDKDVIGPLHEKIRILKQDLARVDGMDKAIQEYINAFKREQDRRKEEWYLNRTSRNV